MTEVQLSSIPALSNVSYYLYWDIAEEKVFVPHMFYPSKKAYGETDEDGFWRLDLQTNGSPECLKIHNEELKTVVQSHLKAEWSES